MPRYLQRKCIYVILAACLMVLVGRLAFRNSGLGTSVVIREGQRSATQAILNEGGQRSDAQVAVPISKEKRLGSNPHSKNENKLVNLLDTSSLSAKQLDDLTSIVGFSRLKEIPQDYPYYFTSNYSLPVVDGHTCRDNVCSEYLSAMDAVLYKSCFTKTMKMYDIPKDVDAGFNGRCRFMNGTNRYPVALASFPGSGNTWMRQLLEQATGICTGAVYSDPSLRLAGFNGEFIRSGAVLAVKTHYHREVVWSPLDPSKPSTYKGTEPQYGGAILLVRNPFDAVIADWNRWISKRQDNVSHHVDNIEREYFGNNTDWQRYFRSKAVIWKLFFQAWVGPAKASNHPFHVVRFEDVKEDKFEEVKKILDFLHFDYEEDELRRRLSEDINTFKRKTHEDFEHFTPEQKDLFRSTINGVVKFLRTYNDGNTYGIEEYVRT